MAATVSSCGGHSPVVPSCSFPSRPDLAGTASADQKLPAHVALLAHPVRLGNPWSAAT